MPSKFLTELSSDYEKLFETEMLIQIFCVLGLNIFVLHFLMNGLKKEMENLFLENRIFRHNYLISFLGNCNIYDKFQHFILYHHVFNY